MLLKKYRLFAEVPRDLDLISFQAWFTQGWASKEGGLLKREGKGHKNLYLMQVVGCRKQSSDVAFS